MIALILIIAGSLLAFVGLVAWYVSLVAKAVSMGMDI